MDFEVSTAAEMIAALHPALAGDEHFLRGVTAALADLGTTDEARLLAFAQGYRAATLAAQAEAGPNAEATFDADAKAKAAREEERQRFAAIMALDEAKGREKAACHVAATTDLSVDAVAGLLKTIPIKSPGDWLADHVPPRPVFHLPPNARRAKDAPNGLVEFDPAIDMPAAHATVAFEPYDPLAVGSQSSAKAVWSKVVAKLNQGPAGAAS